MKLEETIIERHTIGTSGDSAPHVLSSYYRNYVFGGRSNYCPKGLLCGRVSKNHVCPSVCISVRVSSVAIKNDQVLNGKSSLSKVSGSKRDPKRDQIDGLIARF